MHGPDPRPYPQVANDLWTVEAAGAVLGELNTSPRRCQTQQRGIVQLTRHPPKQIWCAQGKAGLPCDSICTISNTGLVKPGGAGLCRHEWCAHNARQTRVA